MWIFVFLLNLLARRNFVRLLAAWTLIMAFFLYCFVHEAFDQPMSQNLVLMHRITASAPAR